MEGIVGLITILTDDLKPMKAFYSEDMVFSSLRVLNACWPM